MELFGGESSAAVVYHTPYIETVFGLSLRMILLLVNFMSWYQVYQGVS
jgi:hypothetical protein